jgi:hypothetical protein
VPTRIRDEDTYPVGGFSSLSTRGSLESLLHSQLAYMEKDERPDLFDIKFLRDELLYYARDENQFWRRRRTFVFALFPDLLKAHFKDAELPWQRIILLLGLLVAAVRKLSEWLATDALAFEFLLLADGERETLAAEQTLLETLLREAIVNGTAVLERVPSVAAVAQRCAQRARRSQCHCLLISTRGQGTEAEGTVVSRLQLDRQCPALGVGSLACVRPDSADAVAGWGAVLQTLLENWV